MMKLDNTLLFTFYGSELHTNPLTNMISVGRSDINDSRPTNANRGANTITLYAPGQEILSTFPQEICTENPGVTRNTRVGIFLECECEWTNIYNLYGIWEWVPTRGTHHADGYHRMSGSSMATPHVSGVAALLLSINSNLTTNQLRTAIINSVDIPNIDGINPLEGLCVTNGRLNAYNAVKFVLENYSNTPYTLSNYSNSINTNKTITAGNTYFNEKNGFYKLNVTYAKQYEFIISSTKAIDVVLYDEDFNELHIKDLYSDSLKTHIIQNLSVGTYYFKTSYKDENDSGTINTKIVSRNTVYLNYNQNDILINTHNGVNEYYYNNTKGAGFYEFRLTGTKVDGTTVTYPAGAVTIYSDISRSICMDKFSLSGYSNQARTKSNENSLIVYLPRNGYFYIDVNMPSNNLSSLFFDITSLSLNEINLFDFSETTTESVNIFNETTKGDYFEKIVIDQIGKFNISYNYNGLDDNNILFVLAKRVYNSSLNSYSLDIKISRLANGRNNSFTYTDILENGLYYIGYFNKDDASSFSVDFERVVTQSGSDVLAVDPHPLTPSGSQINIIEKNNPVKSYGETFITQHFTRLIYFDFDSAPSLSRLDYYWYSSNEYIATVSDYGTVLGKNIGTVKIMAVYKRDPSKVFIKEFTIIEDTGTENIIINSILTIELSKTDNGKFKLDFEKINCPYPWFNDYKWDLFVPCQEHGIDAYIVDKWGNIVVTDQGFFILTGEYLKNERVTIVIDVVIVP